jgi:DeoR/GlpR family transcriptional regulator of sugar metabolism
MNHDKKLRIAQKLTDYVDDGETILIESGSVNVLFARELLKIKKVTIVTTNVYLARQFRKNEQARIILLGGIYQSDSEALLGEMTKTCIDQINLHKAFIGIDGYTSNEGFTSRDMLRAEISRYIVRKARDLFIVSDSTKFGRTEFTNICYPADIQHIATNSDLQAAYQKEFTEAGVELILA